MNRLFQAELEYLRDGGREFARLNPKLAPFLAESSTDPDVERLLEGFAFLTGRVREKIDTEMPEFTTSVIKLLWPNFLRTFPSTTMMKLSPKDKAISARQILPKGTFVLSNPIEEQQCFFQTVTDCAVYPLEINGVGMEHARDHTKIVADFKTLSDLTLQAINLQNLRLTLCGDMPTRQMLYLWLGRYLTEIVIVMADGVRRIFPRDKFIPIGFSHDEVILPQQSVAFEGHRLLQEYFVFPDKFYGYDLIELGSLFAGCAADIFSLEFIFERALPENIRLKTENIQLYCVPAINLFETDAEPLTIAHTRTSYRIRPAGFDTDQIEIFSIDAVYSQRASNDEERSVLERTYPAFESFNHEINLDYQGEQVFFYAHTQKSSRHKGLDYDISFIQHNSESIVPDEETVSVDISCFNRHLGNELAIGDICHPAETAPSFVTYSNLTRPTKPVYPPLGGILEWNLAANLSLNYMSLLNLETLAAILLIYDYQTLSSQQAKHAARQRINGIISLNTRPKDFLFKGRPVRGLKSVMEMKESAFHTEGDMYLFSAILAEFFTLYATINSFHELEVHGMEHGEIYQWPAKIGRQSLI